MDEIEAISRLKRSDMEGLQFLVLRHEDKALKTAYLITRDRAMAEDVVQSSFIRAFERASQFDERRPFAPWFLKIVVNDALKAVRRRSALSVVAFGSGSYNGTLESLVDASAEPGQRLEESELQAAVWQAMQRLSPSQRVLVVQKYYLGFSEKEMAANRGSSVGAVKQLLHRARRRLRSALSGPLRI